MREETIGGANVEDTPELKAYYQDLEKYEAGALWTVANKIEPWQPQSASILEAEQSSVSSIADRPRCAYRRGLLATSLRARRARRAMFPEWRGALDHWCRRTSTSQVRRQAPARMDRARAGASDR